MDRRKFIRALAELGFYDESADWGNTRGIKDEHAWEKLRQAPLLINVSAAGRLAIAPHGSSESGDDALRLASAPRYRLEQIAYWLFDQLGQDACHQLGVVLHSSNDASDWNFAQLGSSIEDANAKAQLADMPLRFARKLSPAETAWEQQVQSGKVVGMDDPVWMEKTQEQIDAHLEWIWNMKKGD